MFRSWFYGPSYSWKHKVSRSTIIFLYQDNKSTMLLLNNGKRSSSQRTRAFNIRYFFLTDQIKKNHLAVKYCSTTKMVADYMSKPLQGNHSKNLEKPLWGIKHKQGFVPWSGMTGVCWRKFKKRKKRMHAPIWIEREKLEAYQGPETPGFSHSF